MRAIGIDVSEPSLEKAKALRELCALEERWELRAGSGLLPLAAGEAEQLVLCGMGGELIAQILEESPSVAKSAARIVMQPMGGVKELREYLYTHSYAIYDEMLVRDAGRIYQVIAAKAGEAAPFPPWFPQGCFLVGSLLFEKRDPLLLPLLTAYRDAHRKRLVKAQSKGRTPPALLSILEEAEQLIQLAKGENLP